MPPEKRKRRRRTEVIAGLLLILTALSYVASILLDFRFDSPDINLKEEIQYLGEFKQRQLISSACWAATSFLSAIFIPFYILVFRKMQSVLPWLSLVVMLSASVAYMLLALTGLELYRESAIELIELHAEHAWHYHMAGSSCVGLFGILLAFSRFRVRRIPLFSVILLLASGPVLIAYSWIDPFHLARTASMVGMIIGISLFSIRLINKGLAE